MEGHFLDIQGVDGSKLQVRGCYELNLSMLGRTINARLYVVPRCTSQVLLGADFIRKHGLSYDAIGNKLYFDRQKQWQVSSLTATEETVIPANSSRLVKVRSQEKPGVRAVGPSTIVAKVNCTSLPLAGTECIVDVDDGGHASIMVDNLLDVDLMIPRNLYIGAAEKVSLDQCDEIQLDMSEKPRTQGPPPSAPDAEKAAMLKDILTEQMEGVDKNIFDMYLNLILTNHDVFSRDKADLGRTTVMEHTIRMRDEEPVFVKQFPIAHAHRSVLLTHLQNWLKLGVVSPSKSHYNSPIFLVPKKDGSLRPVLDFRAVNNKSYVDKYSQREVKDCIDAIGQAQSTVFSSLDLTAGFWQLPLNKGSRKYTAFSIPGMGSFEWNCSPMGLLGSPASFGRLMDFVMRFLNAICYQDDVLVHSKTHDDQIIELQKCFDRLRAHGLKLNAKKCSFGRPEVPYLGFLLTPAGVLPGKDKTEAIRNCPPPKNVKQVREFTGLCNYFRQSVKDFARIAAPLNDLTKKNCRWEGGLPEDALKSYNELKDRLTSPEVLAYPNPKLDYHLLVDASQGSPGRPGGLGASLIQIDENGIPKAIGFASKGLTGAQEKYTPYLLELQAACFGIDKFRVHLAGRKFHLYTDHRPLETTGGKYGKTLNRLQLLMGEFDFTINFKPGKDNVVADFLSRNPVSSVDIHRRDLVQLQREDPLIVRLIRDLQETTDRPGFARLRGHLVMKHDILFFKKPEGNMAIFAPRSLIPQILQSAHNSLLGAHMGMFKSRERILERYYWPSLDKDVQDHIKQCMDCQKAKPHSRPNKVPLMPLPQPEVPNHRIHVDLFGPLSTCGEGKKYIICITDAFSKYVELQAIRSKTAPEVARAIMDMWVTRYSTPREIVTDGGKEFANKLLDSICVELGILHKQTSPYHPQCNAQVEVFNRTLRQFLQATVKPPFLDWENLLPALRIAYNTSVSKATKRTPFSLVFGMRPNFPFFDFENSLDYNEDKADILTELQYIREEARKANLLYRKEYKTYYDKANKARARELRKGDLIFVQNDYKVGANPKLHPLFLGPFPVTRITDSNVYYSSGKKQKVAHFDRVKKCVSKSNEGRTTTHEMDLNVVRPVEEEVAGQMSLFTGNIHLDEGERDVIHEQRKSPNSKNHNISVSSSESEDEEINSELNVSHQSEKISQHTRNVSHGHNSSELQNSNLDFTEREHFNSQCQSQGQREENNSSFDESDLLRFSDISLDGATDRSILPKDGFPWPPTPAPSRPVARKDNTDWRGESTSTLRPPRFVPRERELPPFGVEQRDGLTQDALAYEAMEERNRAEQVKKQRERMDTLQLSHLYRNDTNMRETGTKRKQTSPIHNNAKQRPRATEHSAYVPGPATRSRGALEGDIPLPHFPLESAAYRKRLVQEHLVQHEDPH